MIPINVLPAILTFVTFVSFVVSPQESRQVAVTFDDLPANTTRLELENMRQITDKLLKTLSSRHIPAVGFVNEVKLYGNGKLDQGRVDLLRQWIQAGLELGNHSYSHPSLFSTPLEEFQADVLRGEEITRPLVEKSGKVLRYFRHPFLHTGPDLETKRAFESFLSRHGYRVAPVTIDNSEWIFARAYERAFDRNHQQLMGRIADSYISYMEDVFAYYEQQSRALLGHELKQILLLHANRLNGDALDRLVDMMSRRGYRFISLDEALTDSAYGREDGYAGNAGITWLHRWALTEGKRGSFFQGEPETPAFVMEASGLNR